MRNLILAENFFKTAKLSGIFESAAGIRTTDPKGFFRFACFFKETTGHGAEEFDRPTDTYDWENGIAP